MKLANMGYLTGGYQGKLEVLNDFNEKRKVDELAEKIRADQETLLLSDAGMPLISDPGFRLVKKIIEMGGEITSIPGPSAVTTAVCLSGLSADRVLFLGFLPKKKSKREKQWNSIKSFAGLGLTVAIYEPARSVLKTLEEIKGEFANVEVVIARELTKKYEEIIRGEVDGLLSRLAEKPIKGEVVLLWRLRKCRK